MNYVLYYTQPTKTTSFRTKLDALYANSDINIKTITKIIEKMEI